MGSVGELRQELDQMLKTIVVQGNNIRIKLAELEKTQNTPENPDFLEGIPLAKIETKGAAYPLEGHIMTDKSEKEKASYLYLLAFICLLLKEYGHPYAEGLIALERIRYSLKWEETLPAIFIKASCSSPKLIKQWINDVREDKAVDAFVLDAILIAVEMKAVSDESLIKLTQIFLLLGCKEQALVEAAEAAYFIYIGDKARYLQRRHCWDSFHPEVADCYFCLVGDLNIGAQVKTTSYYAVWPEKINDKEEGPRYAPRIVLETNQDEGAVVEKGELLFTLYAASKTLDDFKVEGLKLGYRSNNRTGWTYLFHYFNQNYLPSLSSYDAETMTKLQTRLEKCKLSQYQLLHITAQCAGVIHWSPLISQIPFQLIKKVDYAILKDEGFCLTQNDPHFRSMYKTDVELFGSIKENDLFVLDLSVSPAFLRKMVICRVTDE